MRIRVALFVLGIAVSLLLAFAAPVAIPQSVVEPKAVNCTKTGGPGDNVLSGTKRKDVICALGGHDYAHGKSGNDTLRGGTGRDVLIGGKGKDKLLGNAGNDRLFAVDGRGGDVLNGGPGPDRCFIDTGDVIRGGCERSFIGTSLNAMNSLSNSFGGALTLAEELIAEVVPTIPGLGDAAQTVTTTITVPFPPCTPPPPTLPNPCG